MLDKQLLEERKQKLLALNKRPTRDSRDVELKKLAIFLSNVVNPAQSIYDEEFTNLLKEKKPHWFLTHKSMSSKQEILRFEHPRRPSINDKNPTIASLARRLQNYMSPSSSQYDRLFSEQLRAAKPHWFTQKNTPVICSNGREYNSVSQASKHLRIYATYIWECLDGLRGDVDGLTFKKKE